MKNIILMGILLTVICSFGQTKTADDDLIKRTEEWNKLHPGTLPHWMTPDELERINEIGKGFIETDPPVGPVRQSAEFERMQSVLIRYPFGIPVAFIKQLSEVTDVVTVCLSTEKKTIVTSYLAAGIDTSKCDFLFAPSDSYWTRDYGPWYVVNGNNEVGVCDVIYNRPRPNDDDVPVQMAAFVDEPLYGMSVVATGGNYMTDGMGIGASTTIVYTESYSTLGISEAQVDQRMNDYLGIHTYHVVPDPNNTYIDHIDCWGKFLDVDKILIRSVPTSHAQYDEIEATAAYFASQVSSYGNNYQVYRVNTPNDEPYTNSLILNDHVFVPIKGTSYDAAALAVYQAAMPGYTITGVLNNTSTPWESTDALHCRTRGTLDKEKLHIQHIAKVLDQSPNESYQINADIISYGGHTINLSNTKVYYKVNSGSWNSIQMTLSKGAYTATIPQQAAGSIVSYYIHSEDNSGRAENHPFIGSADPHVFNVANQPDITLSQTDTLRVSAGPSSTGSSSFDIGNIGSVNLTYNLSVDYLSKGIKGSGGPDTFGYSWKDSDEPDGPVFNWFEISSLGNALPLSDDGVSALMNMGMTFNFYGTDYSSVVIGDNGALTFTGTALGATNAAIPSTATPNALIAAFWDDLNAASTSSGDVFYYYDSANSRFIVEYNAIVDYGTTNTNTFQILLYASGKIVLQYKTMNGLLNECTVGIENATGTVGTQVVYNAAYLKNNFAIEFSSYQLPEWLSLNPVSGTVIPSGSGQIAVTADAADLETGDYYADIIITSNDQGETPLTIPVKFTVSDILSAPANLIITGAGTSAQLNWDAVVGANLYKIYRSTTDPYSGFTQIGTSATNSYTDSSLLGTRSFYKITADNVK